MNGLPATQVTYRCPFFQKRLGLLLSLLVLLTSGCEMEDQVFTEHGQRSSYYQTSLNGTRTLGEMFSRAGHHVRSWRYLSPSLDHADIIVWAPDDFEPPSIEVQEWLIDWLSQSPDNEPGRILIYIGRDFDAAPAYWKQISANPPAGLKAEYARRLREAKSEALSNRPTTLQETECYDWFTLDTAPKKTKVQRLSGPWARGIDASKTNITRHTRLLPDDPPLVLLADENRSPIVSEIAYEPHYELYLAEEGRVIFVENGSFLLNAPLVNHEHRKLAGKLIDYVGPTDKQVVFLESEAGGPMIREHDPSSAPPTGLRLFRIWPIGAVLTQLAVLGIIFAMMRWPLFGLPRSLIGQSKTDFGSHIAALGRLLRDARDRPFAYKLLRLYRQSLPRDTAACEAPVVITSNDTPTPPSPPTEPPLL